MFGYRFSFDAGTIHLVFKKLVLVLLYISYQL